MSSPAIVVNGQGQALPLQTMLPPTSDLTPAMRRSVSDRSLAYLLLAPTIAVLFALTIYPLIYSIKISLQGESGNWTIQNFTRLVADHCDSSSGYGDELAEGWPGRTLARRHR